jgi:glycosyltransferase involved in cell wall biosynthesis
VNVLQLHATDAAIGGGSIAMLRLQKGMRKAGIQSRILCINPTSADSVMLPQARGENRLRAITWRLGLNDLHCIGTFKIPTLSAYAEADLLHVHCLHSGFFNYLALPSLTKDKPALYTLHDMWPFTGHCVHSFDCERWKSGCGKCPYPDLPNTIRRDGTRWEWSLKDWSYRRSNLTIVTPSRWMYELARQSMLSHLPIHHIPHGVDTEAYRPLDREMSRDMLGIPPGKNVLLYLARRMNPSHKASYIKGADVLAQVLRDMPPSLKRDTVLLLVGEGADCFADEVDMATIPLGFMSSDRLKALVYSAADLFLFPSRAENFPLVLLESMACGTPSVAFRVGGVPELVREGVTGLLADPNDAKQFSANIVRLFEDRDLRRHMGVQCRAIALEEYTLGLHIDRHVALYQESLKSVAV